MSGRPQINYQTYMLNVKLLQFQYGSLHIMTFICLSFVTTPFIDDALQSERAASSYSHIA